MPKKFPSARAVLENEAGRIGYILAWFMGVPASVLVVIYLLRGGH